MASKSLLVLGLLLAAAALVSSEFIARELEDTHQKAAAKEAAGVMEQKYGGPSEVAYPVVVDQDFPPSYPVPCHRCPPGYPYSCPPTYPYPPGGRCSCCRRPHCPCLPRAPPRGGGVGYPGIGYP